MTSFVRSPRGFLPLRLASLQISQRSLVSLHSLGLVNKASSSSTTPSSSYLHPPSYSTSSNIKKAIFPILHTRFQSSHSNMPATLKTGDTIPSGHFKYVPFSPELSSPTVCGNPTDLKTDAWKGKKIVLFGVPGAFTKNCSVDHLPGFIEKAAELKSKGVSGVYCIASNDHFVMSAWGRLHGSNEHVEMISDHSLQWLEAAGLTADLSSHSLGKRASRFALILDDLKATYVGVEEHPSSVTGSGVDAVLAKL